MDQKDNSSTIGTQALNKTLRNDNAILRMENDRLRKECYRGLTKRQISIKVFWNYLIGFFMAWAIMAILLAVRSGASSDALGMTMVFTFVSIGRSWIIDYYSNWYWLVRHK